MAFVKLRAVLTTVGLSVLIFGSTMAAPAFAASSITIERAFPNLTFKRPILAIQAPDQIARWYVVEQGGRILTFEDRADVERFSVFADIRRAVDANHSETGLLGAAFHPRFAENGEIFLSYTRTARSLESILSRFQVGAEGTLNRDSEEILLKVPQPFRNHNGGHIAFGPDGFLYFGLGDGGAGGDPRGNGQNKNSLLGAMLRLDVDSGVPYSIPADNPFASGGGRPEIYAYGLRNPWRWSFDRETGQLWAADVGQRRIEEIDIIQNGGNYGWNIREGTETYKSAPTSETLIAPIVQYSHNLGCSVTGGYVYRGDTLAALQGTYLFGDFCSGRIWGLDSDSGSRGGATELIRTDLNISSFAEARDGRIFVIDLNGGIYEISGAK
jgi:glucose/arabinose dehydrogenase